jgi:hypothetical protein
MAALMLPASRHLKRSLLTVGLCAAVLLGGESRPAEAASPEDCRRFHQECTEARAAGYRDVGICNVERLECLPDRDRYARKRSHVAGSDDEHDVERAHGERSVGP